MLKLGRAACNSQVQIGYFMSSDVIVDNGALQYIFSLLHFGMDAEETYLWLGWINTLAFLILKKCGRGVSDRTFFSQIDLKEWGLVSHDFPGERLWRQTLTVESAFCFSSRQNHCDDDPFSHKERTLHTALRGTARKFSDTHFPIWPITTKRIPTRWINWKIFRHLLTTGNINAMSRPRLIWHSSTLIFLLWARSGLFRKLRHARYGQKTEKSKTDNALNILVGINKHDISIDFA